MATSRGEAPVIDRDEHDQQIQPASSAHVAPAPAATNQGRRRGRAARARTGTWMLALRDLQWRRRRFGIAIAGTALVFGMTLLLAGLASSFRIEATRTIDALRSDGWVVRSGITGPFTALSTMPSEAWRVVLNSPTVQEASPIIVMHQVVRTPRMADVNLFGYKLGGLGEPPLMKGRFAARRGEAVADRTLALDIGTTFTIAGHRFKVIGLTKGMTFNAGSPNVYMPIADAQAIAFEGRDVANAVLVRGLPDSVPKELQVMTNDAVKRDLLRPLDNAISAIDMVQLLLWIVAVNIIGAVVYLSALERVRDFAVLKATGYSTNSLLVGLGVQAVVVSLGACTLAIGVGHILTKFFPLPVTLQLSSMLALPAIGIVVGLIASLFGVKRAGSVDPALAFGGP